ncbi:MAG: hypothetical protein ACLFQV_12070, partial [Vulcanimicrobiota bacterium]
CGGGGGAQGATLNPDSNVQTSQLLTPMTPRIQQEPPPILPGMLSRPPTTANQPYPITGT